LKSREGRLTAGWQAANAQKRLRPGASHQLIEIEEGEIEPFEANANCSSVSLLWLAESKSARRLSFEVGRTI
jgi:hypothetical protein